MNLPGYDAGSEFNDESCANIPGPACAGFDGEAPEYMDPEGFVTPPLPPDIVTAKAKAATDRFRSLVGLNGKTCCVLVTDVHSGACQRVVRRDATNVETHTLT